MVGNDVPLYWVVHRRDIVCLVSFNRLLYVFSKTSLYSSPSRIEMVVATYISPACFIARIVNIAACPSLSHKFNLVPI